MKDLPPAVRRKASAIGHSETLFFCPLSEVKADWLLRQMDLPRGAVVLDIGCGRAGLLRRLLSARPDLRGVGVDLDGAAIAAASAHSRSEGLDQRLELVAEDAATFLARALPSDAVLCVGSSHAVGGLDGLAAVSKRLLRPGGVLLVGDGFWRSDPSAEYLAALGAEPGELTTHAGNAERLTQAGLTVIATATASDDEWDDYEGRYHRAKVTWARANMDDPDASAILQSARTWYEAYLRWGRETLGFGWYVGVL